MYSRKVEGGNVAKANSQNIRISVKNAKPVCKAVRGLELKRAKKFLEDVLKEKKSINGRFCSKTTQEVLNIISSAEKNAEFKNLDLDKMYIFHISALEGTHMRRRRRKSKFGSTLKSAHLEIILKEKGAGKEMTKEEKKPVKKEEAKEKTNELKEVKKPEEKQNEVKKETDNKKVEKTEEIKTDEPKGKTEVKAEKKEVKETVEKEVKEKVNKEAGEKNNNNAEKTEEKEVKKKKVEEKKTPKTKVIEKPVETKEKPKTEGDKESKTD
ncbi:MAG: hypothetical protein KAU95_03185 [Candidatus Aenigmarchaeota archaeon]|nr:hypothetical protein [Candidatus Aenigmarchaeota archaeon]